MTAIPKDPDSVEPYGFDWTPWLAEIGVSETISTSTWTVTPAGELTLTSPTIVTGTRGTQIKATGGRANTCYTLTNSIITSSAWKDDRSLHVLVVER